MIICSGPLSRFNAPVHDIALLRDRGKASIPIREATLPIYFPFEDIEYLSNFEHSNAEHSTIVLIHARVTRQNIRGIKIVGERIFVYRASNIELISV